MVAEEAEVLVGAYEQCVQTLDEEATAGRRHKEHAKNIDFWFVSLLLVIAFVVCAAVSWKMGKKCANRKQEQSAQLRMINYHLAHSEDLL